MNIVLLIAAIYGRLVGGNFVKAPYAVTRTDGWSVVSSTLTEEQANELGYKMLVEEPPTCGPTEYTVAVGYIENERIIRQYVKLTWESTTEIDGVAWTYRTYLNGDKVYVCIGSGYSLAIPAETKGKVVIPSEIAGHEVTTISTTAFGNCSRLESITIPASVSAFEDGAFIGCQSLEEVIFLGVPPENIKTSGLLAHCACSFAFPREYGSKWMNITGTGRMLGYLKTNEVDVCVTSSVRSDDPSVIDVVYKVKSDKPTVKVRAVAYIDGERSFSKIVRMENLVEGTEVNVGDAVSANEEHTISWKASEDLNVDLAKVKVEVLAVENELLPLEMIRIPAIGDKKAMELSWNVHTKNQLFDALLWLYADKTTGMTLTNGVLSGDGKPFLAGTAFSHADDAIAFIFKQMGYSVLKGDALTYANKMTRLGLTVPDAYYGEKNYAYRWLEK